MRKLGRPGSLARIENLHIQETVPEIERYRRMITEHDNELLLGIRNRDVTLGLIIAENCVFHEGHAIVQLRETVRLDQLRDRVKKKNLIGPSTFEIKYKSIRVSQPVGPKHPTYIGNDEVLGALWDPYIAGKRGLKGFDNSPVLVDYDLLTVADLIRDIDTLTVVQDERRG